MNIPWLILATLGAVAGVSVVIGEALHRDEITAVAGWTLLGVFIGAAVLSLIALWAEFA